MFNVRDTVYCSRRQEKGVIEKITSDNYCIHVGFGISSENYTKDGKYYMSDEAPSLELITRFTGNAKLTITKDAIILENDVVVEMVHRHEIRSVTILSDNELEITTTDDTRYILNRNARAKILEMLRGECDEYC